MKTTAIVTLTPHIIISSSMMIITIILAQVTIPVRKLRLTKKIFGSCVAHCVLKQRRLGLKLNGASGVDLVLCRSRFTRNGTVEGVVMRSGEKRGSLSIKKRNT